MKLKLLRFHDSKDDTLGLLFINGLFAAFIIEDEGRAAKVAGETRIPAGTYKLGLRYHGKHYERFKHPIIEAIGVPGFTDILIHPGNTEKDTEGCLLPGNSATFNPVGNSRVGESVAAYNRIHTPIVAAIQNEGAEIEVVDEIAVGNPTAPVGLA